MSRPVAFTNARIVDPASGYDGPGAVIVTEGVIADVAKGAGLGALSSDVEVIDAGGALLIPGLIDIRVKTGEPGSEPKETLKSAALAAAAGGVTTIVVQPDTHPVMDEPAVVDFILRRSRDIGLIHVYPAGAATKGLGGAAMAGTAGRPIRAANSPSLAAAPADSHGSDGRCATGTPNALA